MNETHTSYGTRLEQRMCGWRRKQSILKTDGRNEVVGTVDDWVGEEGKVPNKEHGSGKTSAWGLVRPRKP